MPKIKVFVTLVNRLNNEQIKKTYEGFLNDEKLAYKEEDKIVTIYRNSNTIKMIRRSKENLVTLNFMEGKTKKSHLEMMGLEPLEIETDTSLLENNKYGFHICYRTRVKEEIMGDYDFCLQYEVEE
ncbi:MAG: hypothetical protein HFH08_06830 [Bacilli bacterium]|nr:hypothetical protein [Bacilli bacterium]